MIFPNRWQRRKEVNNVLQYLGSSSNGTPHCICKQLQPVLRRSLMFPAGARSPPCSGSHCREKQDALCAQAALPVSAVGHAGLFCGAIQSHPLPAEVMQASDTFADKRKTRCHHSFYLCSHVRAQENRF